MPGTENQKTIVRVSNDAEIWIRHGDEMMFKGEYAKALTFYDKALAVQSDSAKALHSKANALEALGKYEDALRCYDSALRCDPGDAECWFNKGVTLKKIGRETEGIGCIENGVHIAMGSG
jgi:tetratricopeptide (TPR) repeat protein